MFRTLAAWRDLRPAAALIAACLCVVAVAGCQKKPDESARADKPPDPAAPLALALSDGSIQVTLSLPESIKVYPELHSALYAEGETSLRAFMDSARKDRESMSPDDAALFGFTRDITWTQTGETSRLYSLFAREDEFTGGAHPNTAFQSVIWDKSGKARLQPADLFAPGADLAPVDTFLCRQIEAERSRRTREPQTQAGSGFTCPKVTASHLILIPADSGGKIAAIDVLFAPYEVGAYAEGPYEIRVPTDLLKSVLSPDLSGDFGGQTTVPPVIDAGTGP